MSHCAAMRTCFQSRFDLGQPGRGRIGSSRRSASRENSVGDFHAQPGLIWILVVLMGGGMFLIFEKFRRDDHQPETFRQLTREVQALNHAVGSFAVRMKGFEDSVLASSSPNRPGQFAETPLLTPIEEKPPLVGKIAMSSASSAVPTIESAPKVIPNVEPIIQDAIPRIPVKLLEELEEAKNDNSSLRIELATANATITEISAALEKLQKLSSNYETEIAALNKELREVKKSLAVVEDGRRQDKAAFTRESERLARSVLDSERLLAEARDRLAKLQRFASDRKALLDRAKELKNFRAN